MLVLQCESSPTKIWQSRTKRSTSLFDAHFKGLSQTSKYRFKDAHTGTKRRFDALTITRGFPVWFAYKKMAVCNLRVGCVELESTSRCVLGDLLSKSHSNHQTFRSSLHNRRLRGKNYAPQTKIWERRKIGG